MARINVWLGVWKWLKDAENAQDAYSLFHTSPRVAVKEAVGVAGGVCGRLLESHARSLSVCARSGMFLRLSRILGPYFCLTGVLMTTWFPANVGSA